MPRRAPQSEVERAGFDIGQRGPLGAMAKYGSSVVGDYARSAGRGAMRVAKPLARGAALLSGDVTPLIPEIGVEPDEPIGDYARGLGMLEPTPQPERLRTPAPQAKSGFGMTPGGRGWQLIEGRAPIPEIGAADDEAARAGVRARAAVPREVGPIDPLSLSASDIESDAGARALLDARHAQRLESIDLGDPYLRARAAEQQGAALTAEQEGLGLVPTDEAPDTTVYEKGGVYRNRREPRFTGGEYKKQLGRQLEGEIAIGRATAGEGAKAQTEENRRRAFYDASKSAIVQQAQAQAQQLQQTLKGDQLAMAMQELKKRTGEQLQQALVESFAIGARFNVKADESYR